MRLMRMRFVIYIDVTYEWFAIGCSTESMIRDLKLKHDINSLQNKITDVNAFMWYVELSYIVVNRTKLGNSFPPAQFMLSS